MDMEDHDTLGVGEDCIRMGGNVVQEVSCVAHCVLCGCGLSGCQGAEGNEDGCIDCSAVIQ